MKNMTLRSNLQFAIYQELREDGGFVHGYEILKRIKNRGLLWSHQQVYRELNKMDLESEIEVMLGKPDRKIYKLKEGVECNVLFDKLSIECAIAYPKQNLIKRMHDELCESAIEVAREINKTRLKDHKNLNKIAILSLKREFIDAKIKALINVGKENGWINDV